MFRLAAFIISYRHIRSCRTIQSHNGLAGTISYTVSITLSCDQLECLLNWVRITSVKKSSVVSIRAILLATVRCTSGLTLFLALYILSCVNSAWACCNSALICISHEVVFGIVVVQWIWPPNKRCYDHLWSIRWTNEKTYKTFYVDFSIFFI